MESRKMKSRNSELPSTREFLNRKFHAMESCFAARGLSGT